VPNDAEEPPPALGCPQLFVDPGAPAEQWIVLVDDAKAGKLDGITLT
jgi:hypothetical protein